jgi:hypothetical protein
MTRWTSLTGLVVAALLGSMLAIAGVGNAANMGGVAGSSVNLQSQALTVGAIEPNSGSVAGETEIEIALTTSGVDLATATLVSVTISGVPATVSAFTASTVTATTGASPNRAAGAADVEVSAVIGGTLHSATKPLGYIYRPLLEAPITNNFPGGWGPVETGGRQQLVLGALASRTQGKKVTTSGSGPEYLVTGIDSRTGLEYEFFTDSATYTGSGGEGHEGTEVTIGGGLSTLGTYTSSTVGSFGGRNGLVLLTGPSHNCSSFNNVNPITGNASFCSVFGPEVYSEPFYATGDQALAFDWAAQYLNDDYEVYAFLVRVPDPSTTAAIPASTSALNAVSAGDIGHHTIVMYSRARRSSAPQWFTSSGNVPEAGHYRFRFVNGTWDASGGKLLGAQMNIDPMIIVGLANEIDFPNPGNRFGEPNVTSLTLPVSSSAGAAVTMTSNTPSVCTVTGTTATTVTVLVKGAGPCSLAASQGAVGQYAPAATVTQGFTISGPVAPVTAPVITSATGESTAISVTFTPPSDDGSSPILDYQYRLDGGDWVTVTVSGATQFTISGLTNGTEYLVEIRARNALGFSPISNSLAATPAGQALPPALPALINLPTLTTPPSTVAPSTTVPATTPSTVAPSTTIPLPVPQQGGVLPALPPGASQVFVDGVPEVVEVFVADSTDLVLRGDGFQMALAGECSFGCTIRTDAEGRQVLELEENGFAKVQGEGFKPGTPVYIWLFSEPKFLGELTVLADGSFAGSVSIAGIENGTHTLQVNGTSADGKARTANLGVLVSPEGVPTPLPGRLPATGSDAGLLTWVLLFTALGGALVWMSRRRTVPTQR